MILDAAVLNFVSKIPPPASPVGPYKLQYFPL